MELCRRRLRLERVVVLLERLVGEAGSDLADELVRAAFGVVTREMERSVDVGTLPLAVVATDDDEVERVADSLQVILLELFTDVSAGGKRSDEGVSFHRKAIATDLEPVDTPPTRFVARAFAFEHLDHQAFAAVLDRLVKEELDLVDRRGILGLRKGEFAFDGLEMLAEENAAFVQVLCEQRLGTKNGRPS